MNARFLIPALLFSSLPVLAAPSGEPEAPAEPNARAAQEETVVRSWLVVERVDGRGRRPFRPDAVFHRHVFENGAAPPAAGETIAGENGEFEWSEREADENGWVGGRLGYAFARVESERERVVIARLRGASTLLVNGEAYVGDHYNHGWGGVPVRLRAGENLLYVNGMRGRFKLALVEPENRLVLGTWNVTRPDLRAGEAPGGELGFLVMNASLEGVESLTVRVAGSPLFVGSSVDAEGLPPLGVRSVAVRLEPASDNAVVEDEGALAFTLTLSGHPDEEPVEHALELDVVREGGVARRTFRSRVDGSVQYYAVLPPAGEREEDAATGLVLSAHGAGVHAKNQAGSYAAKPDFWIVAPTNRRSFGFDWQDWGRIDAYEVLADALARTGVDRSRVYVTGHSMGGHGAWHLAANDPDGFAAVAPSAGWQSFDTYGGRPEGELRELWHAADRASRTVDLLSNLVQMPTYILHGGGDTNVPAKEALRMFDLLREAGGRPTLHVHAGAGHWWSDGIGPKVDCLDWPGIFTLFRRNAIPALPESLDFTTVDPVVDAEHHWVRVLQPTKYGELSRVKASWNREENRVELDTENVRRLQLSGEPSRAGAFVLDGAELAGGPADFARVDGAWTRSAPPGPEEKSPARGGPLKRGFDRDFVLVVPTAGSAAENAAALARANYDAGVWWYRANGDASIVTDADFLARSVEFRGRNAIAYGNADTNAAWDRIFDAGCPVRVTRGAVALGGRSFEGDSPGALFVRPRRDDPDALAVGLASSGPRGDRLAPTLALFVSGVGYPDYCVFGPGVLTAGDGGVLAAGFFDHAWRLEEAGAGGR